MSRLALLTPLPPARSGIADYSIDLARLLSPVHSIDLFHDGEQTEVTDLPPSCTVRPAREFLARHSAVPYDLAVYQMGNGPAHDFLYDLFPRVPGLLVLHDLVLHHARARMFLEAPAVRAYRAHPASAELRAQAQATLAALEAEIAYSHPEAARRLLPVHLGTIGRLLPYAYPLFRLPVEAARVVAVHNDFMREAIVDAVPEARVVRVPMALERVPIDPARVQSLRKQHGVKPDEIVVASFGLLTPEKGVETVARAMARAQKSCPQLRLWLVGPVPDVRSLLRLLRGLGAGHTLVTGRVPLDELPVYMEAADVVAHLRYPTARETSAALLRILAQGRPTVISDLEHLGDVPGDAVIRADATDEEGALTRAIERLAADANARRHLGARAAAFMAEAHSTGRSREAYEQAIALALATPDPPRRSWPAHWPLPSSATTA